MCLMFPYVYNVECLYNSVMFFFCHWFNFNNMFLSSHFLCLFAVLLVPILSSPWTKGVKLRFWSATVLQGLAPTLIEYTQSR